MKLISMLAVLLAVFAVAACDAKSEPTPDKKATPAVTNDPNLETIRVSVEGMT